MSGPRPYNHTSVVCSCYDYSFEHTLETPSWHILSNLLDWWMLQVLTVAEGTIYCGLNRSPRGSLKIYPRFQQMNTLCWCTLGGCSKIEISIEHAGTVLQRVSASSSCRWISILVPMNLCDSVETNDFCCCMQRCSNLSLQCQLQVASKTFNPHISN